MPVILGGPTALAIRRKGDLMISFQHVNGEEAMILYPARPRMGAGGYCICLSAAWKYADEKGLALGAIRAAEVMGFGRYDRSALFRIKDAILENLPDLVNMKPEPKELAEEGAKFGEMDLVMDGKVLTTQEVVLPKGFHFTK